MGLDMYLTKKTYVKNWEFMKPEEKHQISIKKGGKKRLDIDTKKVSYIEEEAIYWRKANAVHSWFVKNVQNGEDDCRSYYVSKKQLQQLKDACALILNGCILVNGKIKNGYHGTETGWEPNMEDGRYIQNPETAKAILPTQEGFFFGSTDYDEYYYEDIKYTYEELNKLLTSDTDGAEYYYQSSW